MFATIRERRQMPILLRASRTLHDGHMLGSGCVGWPGSMKRVMTVKERLQQVVAEMSEEEASEALALVAGARAGATPVDVYGTAWGEVLADVDPRALATTGVPSIALPDGIPPVR
jgi:hypothetical protein